MRRGGHAWPRAPCRAGPARTRAVRPRRTLTERAHGPTPKSAPSSSARRSASRSAYSLRQRRLCTDSSGGTGSSSCRGASVHRRAPTQPGAAALIWNAIEMGRRPLLWKRHGVRLASHHAPLSRACGQARSSRRESKASATIPTAMLAAREAWARGAYLHCTHSRSIRGARPRAIAEMSLTVLRGPWIRGVTLWSHSVMHTRMTIKATRCVRPGVTVIALITVVQAGGYYRDL